jgi:methylated-DNA-[protein]-cysteine S-methyltransferase
VDVAGGPEIAATAQYGAVRADLAAGKIGHIRRRWRQNAAMTASTPSKPALSWASLSTPVGEVSVGCSRDGVARVRYGAPPDGQDDQDDQGLAAPAREQLAEYFAGRRTAFDLQLDWSAVSNSRRRVLEALAGSVRYGQTISYGALADRAGLAADGGVPPARVVGKIMGSNPIPVVVPCHRVLASDGLGGYSGGAGVEVKRWLLILEGALPPTLDWQPAED